MKHRDKLAFAGLLASFLAAASSHGQQPPTRPSAPPAAGETSAVGLAELIARARALLAQGRADEAYAALSPQVRWYGGSPEFDYLLGISALDSGRPGDAILALERVLAVQPGHLQARAEIGRAYLAVNETESARRQFETVAASPVPPEVRRVIDAYLDGIARTEDAAKPQLTAFMEVGGGWDSNVSLGSLSSEWLLGSGIAVTPIGTSRPVSSWLMQVGAGASALIPMGGGWELTVGGKVESRSNASAHTLDTGSLDLVAGVSYRNSCHRLSMLAYYQHLRLSGSSFRDADGAVMQWRCDVDARTQLGVYLEQFNLRFADQEVRNARRTLAGLTLARVLDIPASPVLVATAYGGEEVPRQDVPQLRHSIRGARAVLSAGLGNGWRGSASLSGEFREFSGEEPLFGTVRHDRTTELRLAADRRFGRHWSIIPEVVYTRNASTLPPNDFQRLQALATARYVF